MKLESICIAWGGIIIVWMITWTIVFCEYYKRKLEKKRKAELKKRWVTLTY